MADLPSKSSVRVVRFGLFELDPAAGELRKNGARLRLQEQPFQILAMLVARPGEIITREELRRNLWPADTFVDFDHSLNTAVNKLREALGDSASNPRYIETLARRGYRFIAPVQLDGQPAPAGEIRPTREAAPATTRPVSDLPTPNRGVTRGLFAVIQVMYLIFYLVALFRLHAIAEIAESFLPEWEASLLMVAVIVTGGAGIPLRCYLLSAVAFDYQPLGHKFRQIFPWLLALDELWAVAPFLLARTIGFGAAFAASAALLYVPFSERTLVRMAYRVPPELR